MGWLRDMALALGCDMGQSASGRQGFATAAAAKANAVESFADAVAILEYNGEYAWAWPPEYVERLIADNPLIQKVEA